MKKVILFIACSILVTGAYGQIKTKNKHYVLYAELGSSGPNYPFWRDGCSVSEILFEAASKNLLKLYFFNSFDKDPQQLPYREFKEKLLIKREERRESLMVPTEPSYVLEDNKNSLPDSIENRKEIQPEYRGFRDVLSTIGFDYQSIGNNPSLQYLHFYNQDGVEYLASCRAKEAIDLLNASNVLWYREREELLNHIGGDIFLFNWDDRAKIMKDLFRMDSMKAKGKSKIRPDYEPNPYEILIHFNRFRIGGFYIHYRDYDASLDTIPGAILYEQLGSSKVDCRLLGDALLDPACITFSEIMKKSIFEPLKSPMPPVIASPRKFAKISYQNTLSFRFDKQRKMLGDEFNTNMDTLMKTVYRGLADYKLELYKTSKLDSSCTRKEITDRLTMSPYTYYLSDWEPNATYQVGDLVRFKDKDYEFLQANASKIPPGENTTSWKIFKNPPLLYLPQDIAQIDITYQTYFDAGGTVLNKDPVSIKLYFHETAMGMYRSIGDIRYNQLQLFIQSKPGLKSFCSQLVNGEYGLFSIQENEPLRAVSTKE